MRKLPLGVMISTGVHAVALVWASTHVLGRRPPPEPPVATLIEIVAVDRPAAPPPLPSPEPPPLDVALLDDPAPRTPPPGTNPSRAPVPPPITAAPPPAPGPAAVISTTAGAAAGSAVPPGPETAPPSRPTSSLLGMRHGDTPRPVLPVGHWDAIDHVPRGTTPEHDLSTGILHDAGGGAARSDQGPFIGNVAADGTVKLTDQPNLSVHVALPSPRAIGNGLSAWYNSDKTPGQDDDGGPATPLAKSFQASSGATTNRGDRTQPNSNDTKPTVIVPIIGGGFDVSDWLMRNHGIDPYAAKKLAFLDSTRDERVQRGNRFRADQLAHATQLMKRNLDALWAASLDLATRKRALFELWDECAETGDPGLVEGAQDARRLVIGFIRARLPASGPDAFTADELAALARIRQSKAAFRPYDP
jgi:hypothetical protein